MSDPAQHPDLTRALDLLDKGDPSLMLAVALRARRRAEDGSYCECSTPLVVGTGLMCGVCLHNNRDQEIRKLLSVYGAHDFVADPRSALAWCECSWPEDDPRHHGEDRPMATSWGERFEPPHDALRSALGFPEGGQTDGV